MSVFDKQDKVYIIILGILLGIIIFFYIKCEFKNSFIQSQESYINKLEEELKYYHTLDSTYTVKRDSIEYNIIRKDSIITQIKKRYEKQKDNVLGSDDSAVVNKFNELVWSDE